MRMSFVRRSGNEKTGRMPITMTSRSTCPDACSFKGAGCYAEGWPMRLHWNELEAKEQATLEAACASIAALPLGTVWRGQTAGDLPGEADRIDPAGLASIVEANRGRRGFTYTHKPITRTALARMAAKQGRPINQDDVDMMRANRAAVSDAVLNGFTVNVSCDSKAELDALGDALPAVVVLGMVEGSSKGAQAAWIAAAPKVEYTPEGRRIVVCPAQYKTNVTCESCQLCSRVNRACAVGFWAHGYARRKVTNTVEATRPAGKRALGMVQA